MALYNYKGLYVSIIVSFCAMPCMRLALSHPVLSQYLPMHVLIYALLLTCTIFFGYALPRDMTCGRKKKPPKRNEIYYGCCLLMCCCIGGLTFQTWRLKKFGAGFVKHKVEFFAYDEKYVLTPFHLMTEIWMDVVNYFFYAVIIFLIDNGYSCRNVLLYWSGATITGELVATFACITGVHSPALKYTELMHVVHIVAAVWVVFRFLVLKPRFIEARAHTSKYVFMDKILILSLIALSLFAAFRGVAALNGSQKFVKLYVTTYEPYIVHPTRFGAIWVLFTAVYGIPFQLAAIRGILRPGAEWLINMSILYAGSVLQGTLVFLSYSFFRNSEPRFRIPPSTTNFVIGVNCLLVFVAHALMYRCLMEPQYFRRPCIRVVKFPSPSASKSLLTAK